MFYIIFFYACNYFVNYNYIYNLQIDLSGDLNYNNPPEIELSCNASAFAVFASVRSAILERHTRTSNEVYRVSNCNSPPSPEHSETIDTESDDEDRISTIQSLPKVIKRIINIIYILKELYINLNIFRLQVLVYEVFLH